VKLKLLNKLEVTILRIKIKAVRMSHLHAVGSL
jgi:hypothetical protein